MSLLKSFWARLDGRKRLLGKLILIVYAGAVTTQVIDRNVDIERAITVLLGVGYADAIRKA